MEITGDEACLSPHIDKTGVMFIIPAINHTMYTHNTLFIVHKLWLEGCAEMKHSPSALEQNRNWCMCVQSLYFYRTVSKLHNQTLVKIASIVSA